MDIEEQVATTLMMYFPSPGVVPSKYPTLGGKDALNLANQIIPLVRADMQRELGGKINKYLDDLLGYDYSGTRPIDVQDIISGTFKEGE